MAQEIHYEVFRRVGSKGGWSLHDVRSDRDSAILLAQEMMADERATGVKVVKETYNNATGDYLSLKIFEEGHNQVKVPAAEEDTPHAIPCFKPDDLYSYHARQTMARLLTEFLARNRITITEMIHRADMLEKLEATGTLYQHAIQKVAVAQASSTGLGVQAIVKSLNELATQAIHRIYRDQRGGLFPDPAAEQFGDLATKLAAHPDACYLFNGALARHLKAAKGWDEKVRMLIAVMERAPADGPARKLALTAVDAVLAETLSGSAALHELLGQADSLAEALINLVTLFLGEPPLTGANPRHGLQALTGHFAADDLPEARTAVACRIIAEVRSNRRLCPDSLVDELKALRIIANKIVLGVGKYLGHDDLVAAFTLRSRRLVAQEALGHFIAEAPQDEKIERILFVEENVIGVENKRQLASYVMPVLNAAAFENHFQNPKASLLARLQKLAQIQTRTKRSGFAEAARVEFCERLDKMAVQVEARGKLFESIEGRSGNAVEKAQTLLRLAAGGVLTEGHLSGKARELILGYLSRPGFLTGYIAAQATENAKPDSEAVMAGLLDTLGKAGITAETGLRTIAA